MTRGQLIQGILDRKAQLRETRRLACEQAYRAFLARHADVDAARRALARARMAMVRHTGSPEDAAAARAAARSPFSSWGCRKKRDTAHLICPARISVPAIPSRSSRMNCSAVRSTAQPAHSSEWKL